MQSLAHINWQSNLFITDMRLMQQVSRQSYRGTNDTYQINNLNSLSCLIKAKNLQYNFSDQHRQRNQAWIDSKKGSLQGLLQKAKQIRQLHQKKSELKAKQQTNHFYLTPSDFEDLAKFINKSVEYSTYGVIQHSQHNFKFRNNVANKVLKNIKRNVIKTAQNSYNKSVYRIPTGVPNLMQSKQKLEQYLRVMQSLFKTDQKLEDKQWTAAFKAATKLKIWDILHSFTSSIQPGLPLHAIAIKSLFLVEAEFNSLLPSNYDSILYYLTTNYLRNMQGKFKNQGSSGPVWAIAYILYKAGRKEQFYQYLPSSQMRQMFQHVDHTIANNEPQTIKYLKQNGDAFHDQLMYCLNGQAKYSSSVLCNPNSLDIAWIFLRNVGIFKQSESKFIQLRTDLYNSYKGLPLGQTKLKNLLYLLCFQELVQIGPNQMMDPYDFLHYLITIYHNPSFRNAFIRKDNSLQRNLTQRLIQFIQKLLLDERNQSIYYILLIPAQHLANEVSSVIAKYRLMNKIRWKQLAKYLSLQLYSEIIEKTCQKYASLHSQYYMAAQKIQQLQNGQQKALVYIIDMNIKSILTYRKQSQDLSKGENMVKSIFKANENLAIEYESLFQFFKQYQKLSELIRQRNQQKIYKFIRTCKHVLISEQLRVDTATMLQKLIQRNGFECYFYYMKQVARAYEISLTKLGRTHDLQELQRMTLTALVRLLDLGEYKQFAKSQAALSLISTLEESLFRNK